MKPEQVEAMIGSRDGDGTADHDVPFTFGRRPRSEAPYPFSTRQYARALLLRSEIQAGIFGAFDLHAEQSPENGAHEAVADVLAC